MEKTTVALNGEFTADEIETVIADLAKARSCMSPAVPIEPPALDSNKEVLEQDGTDVRFRRLATGGLRIWLRHDGFGWLAFTLQADAALGVGEFFRKEISYPTPH